MRRTLAGVALAVTSMVALSFLIPLALLVRSEARNQAITAAEQRAAALAPVLALTADVPDLRQAISVLAPGDELSVHLPSGALVGPTHTPASLLVRAARDGEAIAQNRPDGWVYLQPVVLGPQRVAVIEEFVPQGRLTRGVAASWGAMTLLALALVVGSTLVADRLAARVVRSSHNLSRASHALGRGDLNTRVDPMGPPELYEAGLAFNAMADRMLELLAVERELVADLSHRLRTPLTALRLAADRMGPTTDAERIAAAIHHLDSELHSIITAARTPLAVGPMGWGLRSLADPAAPGRFGAQGPPAAGCAAAAVIRRKAGFWAVLAEQQRRPFQVDITVEDALIELPEDDLAAVLDALVGNVFRHTAPGTAFAVRLERSAQTVALVVEDAGPGIPDPGGAVARGVSTVSTGLGLDIAHRAAAATRGTVDITRGRLGGTQVEVTFGLAAAHSRGARTKRRRRPGVSSGRARPRWWPVR
ncbi:HAMP domain-containing sensor histidine kinase [Streptomyces sp. H10-C2]|uniref:sensor histidine kinase n=1 Tax=unclassified Streptomyces TaxID=2593676 RepID=UPI0024BA1D16|nr:MULTISPECIES: HAMP domain-containing sensor histidine kinase [unclassified Streptomyces]MDJ0343611.1 HAMP domain-containing sensor histidine kinase [Streptomyces sp. PH10-H1]MDJ0373141.1 HAMP domain-containing sensor histidine kinase [Streptomyces sp. H10-C2]